ncbi:hypothetical protein [Hymenobacter sp. APR13]|uniref:hypothetical protein n=1 Tax=Hymenobacter sp. APR13 TaxID=1356852 RepID=UPI0012E02CF9|nr:hypothetical protein [Hymenobacter sp. APR13]
MKISLKSLSTLSFVIGFFIHIAYFFFIEQTINRTLYNFYTFIGGYISVVGIIFALVQIKSVREEAESIRNSVSKYNNILTLVEITNLSNYLLEARNYILMKDFKTVHQKLTYVKPGVNTLLNRVNKQKIIIEQEEDAPELKDLIFNFKQDLQNIEVSILNNDNFESIDFGIVLRHTDEMATYFSNLTEHLKSFEHES